MKNISFFLSETFQFLEVKFYVYLNRRVFVMHSETIDLYQCCQCVDYGYCIYSRVFIPIRKLAIRLFLSSVE